MSFGEDLDKLVEAHSDGLLGKHHSWERVRLADIAELVNGFAFKSRHFQEKSGTPVLRIRDILKGVPGTKYDASVGDPKMQFVEDGQIVVGMDGDFNSRIWKGGRALINQRVCTLEANSQYYSQKLLSYALPGYLKLINDHTSSVTVKHLSSKTVQDIPLPLPPLNEQRRIVEKIETLFARLDKGEEAVREVQTLLKRYRQSVLKAAVTGALTADWRAERTGQLEHGQDLLARILKARKENWQGRGKYKAPVEPDTRDLPELPEGWVWASVDQVTSFFGNGLSRKPVAEQTDFPILRISATRALKIHLDDIRYYQPKDGEDLTKYWVEKDDLLFTRYNGSGHLVGVCGLMRSDERVLHPDKLIKARPVAVDDLDPEYLELAWNSGATRSFIADHIKTTSGQQGIAGSDIKIAPFPLPSLAEQRVISERLWEAFDKSEKIEALCETELKRSASLRQSILKDAFSGRLVPQDPDDEPASALLERIKGEQSAAPKKTKRKATA